MSVKNRPHLVTICVLVIFSTLFPVLAASFDGTYNYVYNLNGWEEHRVDGGFIVRGGVISSNPSAFSGTVDSSGNVRFTGSSPYGGSATFTGTISSDGTGKETYESRYWNGPFNQTYRWNTGEDIQGYRVDALFKDITSSPQRFLRVGETSHVPLS